MNLDINVNELTIGQAKELIKKANEVAAFVGQGEIKTELSEQEETPFEVGKKYLLRTVTHIVLGELIAIKGKFLVLTKSSWVADTGRYYDALNTGELNEVEPYPNGNGLNFTALIDFCEWQHTLPTEQK